MLCVKVLFYFNNFIVNLGNEEYITSINIFTNVVEGGKWGWSTYINHISKCGCVGSIQWSWLTMVEEGRWVLS